MEPWGTGELWPLGTVEEAAAVEGGVRLCGWQRVAEGTRRRQDDRGGGGFLAVVCVHVDTGSGLWCVCMRWSHLHSWKTLLSCCVNEMCLLLTGRTEVLSLLSALPLVHHQSKTVRLLTCSVLTVSPVPGEQLSCIQYGFSSNSTLILLLRNLKWDQVQWGKSNDFGQCKPETWKKKSQAGYRLREVKRCSASPAYQQLLLCHRALAALYSK